MTEKFRRSELQDMIEDITNGRVGDLAAQHADALMTIETLTEQIDDVSSALRNAVKRWRPIEAREVVVGDIIRGGDTNGMPVRVTAHTKIVKTIRIDNDRFLNPDVLSPDHLIEVWR